MVDWVWYFKKLGVVVVYIIVYIDGFEKGDFEFGIGWFVYYMCCGIYIIGKSRCFCSIFSYKDVIV